MPPLMVGQLSNVKSLVKYVETSSNTVSLTMTFFSQKLPTTDRVFSSRSFLSTVRDLNCSNAFHASPFFNETSFWIRCHRICIRLRFSSGAEASNLSKAATLNIPRRRISATNSKSFSRPAANLE